MLVSANNRAVDHLEAGLAGAAVVQRLQHHVPDAGERPAPELAIHRVPGPEVLMKVPPRRARSRNPEYPIQNKSVVNRRAATPPGRSRQERLEKLPLIIRHQTTNHATLPQRAALNQSLTDLGIHFVHSA